MATIAEVKKIIESVPNDFIFEIAVSKKVPEEILKQRAYPYPYDTERCDFNKSSYDIGWSEGKVIFHIEILEA